MSNSLSHWQTGWRWGIATGLVMVAAGCGYWLGHQRPAAPLPIYHVSSHRPVKTLVSLSGSGNAQTVSFTVPANWDIKWLFTCNNPGESGSFNVSVLTAARHSTSLQSIRHTDASGYGDQLYQHHAGAYKVLIDSTCSWQLSVRSDT